MYYDDENENTEIKRIENEANGPESDELYVYEQPTMNTKEKKSFPRFWTYVITGAVTCIVTFVLAIYFVPAIRESGRLPFTPTTASNVLEQYTTTQGSNLSVVDIAKKNAPCVCGVNITAQSQSLFGQTQEIQGSGSGIILTSDGYIATNDHVVDGATSVSVKLYNGDTYDAKVIGTDTTSDLAVIKIDASNLQYAELGTSADLEVGDLAVAIGNPLGEDFAGSVTVGFISALNRTVQVNDTTYNVIQTDAAINEGNSGGPLINQQGQVIGINSVKISSAEGMGFAIPIDSAKPILDDLMQYGYVKDRPQIGFVMGQEISASMAQMYNVPQGIYVDSVIPGGGAANAGMKSQDIIYKMAGQEALTMAECNTIKNQYKAGDTIEIDVKRKDSSGNWNDVKLNVTLTEAQPSGSN